MINPLKMYTPDYENDDHSPWSPSGGAAWIACPLWPLANWRKEDKSSQAASEGTRLHGIAAQVLEGENSRAAVASEDWDKIGAYVEYCSGLPGIHQVETKINLGYFGFPVIFGSADFITINGPAKSIEVVDLKTGHVSVNPTSPQGKLYLIGAAGDNILEYDTLRFTIHQDGKPNTKEYSGFELLDWLYNVVKPAYERSLIDNPQPEAGETQCRWCCKKGDCPASSDLALRTARDIFSEIPSLTPEQLAEILDKAPLIENFLSAARDKAKVLAETGTEIPGYKLVEGRRTKYWSDEEGLHKFLNRKLKKEDRYTEPQLKSPAQMKKSVAKAYRDDLDQFIGLKPGKLTLKPYSDERHSVTSAELAFKNI